MNKENDVQPTSREEIRKQKEAAKQEKKAEKKEKKETKSKRGRIRLIPIWLRLIIVIVILFLSLITGAMIGYGVVGDGNMMGVFERDTWFHIYDIIYHGTETGQ